MMFDPDTFKLSDYVRHRKLRFKKIPSALTEGSMHLQMVDNTRGLYWEHMVQDLRELGFQLPEDISFDDFLQTVIDCYNGTEEVWSIHRTDYLEQWGPPPEPEVEGPPYTVIYADPPWPYRNKKTGGSHTSGAAQHYSIMSMDGIKDLPVRDLASKDAVLFLWATVPMLPEALDTLKAWGFRYKTSLFWRKTGRLGLGYWYRGQVEILLLGVRGQIKAFRSQAENIIESKPGRHSEKPEGARLLILDGLHCGGLDKLPRVEMFSRGFFDGWDVFGDEIVGNVRLVEGRWIKG
jgi:site-specific DNA-methyltransferase (adenine-specific)